MGALNQIRAYRYMVCEVKKTQAKVKNTRRELDEFGAEWRKDADLKLGRSKLNPNPKAKASPFHAGQAGRRRPIPAGAITHAEAKLLLPPHSKIWTGKAGFWQAQLMVPFHPSAGKHWGAWTGLSHRDACLFVIRDVWDKYLRVERLDRDQCPIIGLFA